MKTWPAPAVPALPGRPVTPRDEDLPRLYDTTTGRLEPVGDPAAGLGSLYVCGITPYDATHMGHAATYVAFDLLRRAWLDTGLDVRFVQNVTDVDDPLFERAERDGVAWQDLAAGQTDLYHDDMAALRVLPPDHYVAVSESVDLVRAAVREMLDSGVAYRVPSDDSTDRDDVYQDLAQGGGAGSISGWDAAEMDEVFAERGGDPDRPGKRGRFDPLLWRGHREGEPSWDDDVLGKGRPGWHIECAVIAREYLPRPFDVQAGGSDLIFPHHEMSALHAQALGARVFARHYAHAGMVGLDGTKMSKSLGNLVFVSALTREGADPMAVRVALLAHHYREDWEWTDRGWREAIERTARWRRELARPRPSATALRLVTDLRAAVRDDLDTPLTVALVDDYCDEPATEGAGEGSAASADLALDAVDALLGLDLRG